MPAVLGALALVGVVLLVLPARHDQPAPLPGPTGGSNLSSRIHDFATSLREDAPYQLPTAAERQELTQTLDQLATGRTGGVRERLTPLGFTVDTGTDAATGRPYLIIASLPNAPRGWGIYLVDLSVHSRVAIQVPHPANDLHTDEVGLELFRRLPGAVLAVSGTHRRVANGAGDVAHQTDSMFHAVAENQSRHRIPQVQLHGFDDASLAAVDVVLSPGAGQASPEIERIGDGLHDAGLDVCRAWRRDCGDLEGKRNKQGITAAADDVPFAHVEMSRSTRDDPKRWGKVVQVIEDTFRSS
ncbi:hypothetical protein [Actinokineospora inagensis]|uniref:hypothetical protein n=1 Tax=Actinokineospora inagensis TaxID=103730 RepID=UPI000478CA3D|nr:hypothetical protein [Actinokineospora inagensis]